MDDFDELENNLFGKRKDSEIGENKKKVAFKDIDENDPLADLNVSDDEDFQESLKEKPVVFVESKKIDDLFGLKSNSPPKIENSTPNEPSSTIKDIVTNNSFLTKNLPYQPPTEESISNKKDSTESLNDTIILPTKENSIEKSTSKMKSIFDDDDDIASNLMDKSKTPISTQAKKTSLMEDLFGSRPKSSPLAEAGKRSNPLKFDVPVTRSSSGEVLTGILNESTSKTINNSGFSLSAPKEPRKGRRASTVQNDPLGLLSMSNLQIDGSPKNKEQKPTYPTNNEVTSKSAVIEDLPEWLGGPKVSKEQKQETEKAVLSEVSLSAKSVEAIGKISGLTDQSVITVGSGGMQQQELTSKLLGIEFNQQATMINMQQQEHELRTAAALSQQSEKLNHLLETQKITLTEQEKQFNMLIARQLERQALLEAQMKTQQDRIDSYIQTLTAQPTTLPSMHNLVNKEAKFELKECTDEKVESESQIQKLQLEKLYLENTLESIREKHEKEISILEDSYKKQVQFLEEAMVQMEKRMQDDLECVEADYKLKVQKLKEEILDSERQHKVEKETLKEEHENLIREIRDSHHRSLEIMQKEHIETIERITKSKESERQAIAVMKTDGTNIENILNKSQYIIEGLENLQKKFESRDTSFIESHDNHLAYQEKNIEYLKELLEKQKNIFTEEKEKLIVTIQNLESNMSELTREFRKQNESFKESEEIFKSREQALLRDRELFIETTNWERERLQAMKESWAKEEDRQLEWLAQERQSLATERGKLQIFNKLKIGADESSKIELEATIKAAQDATVIANQERLKWQEKINELEIQKNNLQEKESNLIEKAKKLDNFTQSAVTIREEGFKALKEARFIEERYKEKFNLLQLQQEMLNQRESKLAAEKLELARERLSFRVSEVEHPEKDIVSNKLDNKIINEEDQSNCSDMPSASMQYTTYFKDIVDPHLVLLKWNLDNNLQPFSSSH